MNLAPMRSTALLFLVFFVFFAFLAFGTNAELLCALLVSLVDWPIMNKETTSFEFIECQASWLTCQTYTKRVPGYQVQLPHRLLDPASSLIQALDHIDSKIQQIALPVQNIKFKNLVRGVEEVGKVGSIAAGKAGTWAWT